MTKAKSAAKQSQKKTVSGVNPLHMRFVLDAQRTLSELTKESQAVAYGKIGSIRMLMATHNALIDGGVGHSESNRRAILAAAAVLETNVDQKIDSLNMFLDESFASLPKSKASNVSKASKNETPKKSKSSKRSKAMRLAWRKRKAAAQKSKIVRKKTTRKNVAK